MKKKLYNLLLSLLFVNVCNAQSPDWFWARGTGGTLNDYGQSVATDAAGNVYVTGSFQATVEFEPGNILSYMTSAGDLDVFILKLDANGNYIWAKQFRGANTDEGLSIAVDGSGNVYTTGYFQGTNDFDPGAGTFNMTTAGNFDIFISKLDSSGNFIWAKQMGGTSLDAGQSIAIGDNGNIYLTGYFTSTADFNPDSSLTMNLTSAGARDIFVAALDSSGNMLWAGQMGGTGTDYGQSVCAQFQGGIYVTGFFSGTADLDLSDSVSFNVISKGGNDAFLAKIDEGGNLVWANAMGGTGSDRCYSATLDSSGIIYTTGYFSATADFDASATGTFNLIASGGSDIFVAAYDSTGSFMWADGMGSSTNDEGKSIVYDASAGGVFLTGYFTATVDFDPATTGVFNIASNGNEEIFVTGLDLSGNFIWAKSAGGTNSEYGNSIAVGASGKLHVAGWIHSPTVQFGTTTITNNVTTGFPDSFVAKLDDIISGVFNPNISEDISGYPNPSHDYFNVALPEKCKSIGITVFDDTGKIVFIQQDQNSQLIQLNIQKFAAGLYSVRLETERYSIVKRLSVVY